MYIRSIKKLAENVSMGAERVQEEQSASYGCSCAFFWGTRSQCKDCQVCFQASQ